ncbi:MAG: hypothetical protein Q9222_007330, partial [Ikaeria aurantiellina]
MHPAPRTIYDSLVDFSALASDDPDFKKLQLTTSLLARDFGLKIELPDDRLCPPDLLDTTSDSYSDGYDPKREVLGLDIGTGASCIYPLLGCAQRPKWKFIATDTDTKSLNHARQNIHLNDLNSRIHAHLSKPSDPLIPLDALGIET